MLALANCGDDVATSLLNIRFLIERQIRPITLDNDDVLDWCNEANADIGMNFNLPAAPETIALTSTDLEYDLPTDLKIINRLRLQSVIDDGLDAELKINYRIYNRKIILPRVTWIAPDDLVVDYYKHLTTFTDVDDTIELDDRYAPIYTFYGLMKYYDLPETAERIGAQEAAKKMNANLVKYQNMKNQLTAYQSLSNEPVTLDGRW